MFVPSYKLSKRFVIKNIPINISLTELKSEIEAQNTGVVLINIFRLKRKNRVTGLWEDSESVCAQKLGEDIPANISIYHTINEVKPYFAPIRLCFKCGFFGHYAKFCTRDSKCLQCGNNDHKSSKVSPCQAAIKKCINCGGDHATTDQKCKFYVRNSEITKIMTLDNFPYFEAKSTVMKQEKKATVGSPDKTMVNFPALPQKNGISLVNSSASKQFRDTRI